MSESNGAKTKSNTKSSIDLIPPEHIQDLCSGAENGCLFHFHQSALQFDPFFHFFNFICRSSWPWHERSLPSVVWQSGPVLPPTVNHGIMVYV